MTFCVVKVKWNFRAWKIVAWMLLLWMAPTVGHDYCLKLIITSAVFLNCLNNEGQRVKRIRLMLYISTYNYDRSDTLKII